MDAVAADLPLYLQMSRYTKGSKAVMEMRTERYLAEQATQTARLEASDDMLITGSISETGTKGENAGATSNDDGFSLDDFLDIINPLQHLPVISTLYQEMTGDEMSPASRVVGGAIFGGPLGAGVSVANAVLEQATGDDLGGHVLSLLQGANPSTSIAAAPIAQPGAQPSAQIAPTRVDPASTTSAAATPPTMPLPTLSTEAFNSLLTQSEQPRRVPTQQREPADIAEAMAIALDEYDFIKLVDDEPAF